MRDLGMEVPLLSLSPHHLQLACFFQSSYEDINPEIGRDRRCCANHDTAEALTWAHYLDYDSGELLDIAWPRAKQFQLARRAMAGTILPRR